MRKVIEVTNGLLNALKPGRALKAHYLTFISNYEQFISKKIVLVANKLNLNGVTVKCEEKNNRSNSHYPVTLHSGIVI